MRNCARLHRICERRIEIGRRWNTVEEALENVEKRRGISNEIGVLQEELMEEIVSNFRRHWTISGIETVANPLLAIRDVDNRTRLSKLVQKR